MTQKTEKRNLAQKVSESPETGRQDLTDASGIRISVMNISKVSIFDTVNTLINYANMQKYQSIGKNEGKAFVCTHASACASICAYVFQIMISSDTL